MTAVEEASPLRESPAEAAARRRREIRARMHWTRAKLEQLEREQAALVAAIEGAKAAASAGTAAAVPDLRAIRAEAVAAEGDTPHVIRTVGGYISLPYAAELFGVNRGRLQTAAWNGLLPAIKADTTRTAPWMVTIKDVARYLMDYPVHRRGGRPLGSKPKTPEERQYEADVHAATREKYCPWHPSQQQAPPQPPQPAAGE